MAKLDIQFFPDADHEWAHIIFKQEGMRGFKLPSAWFPDFVGALENTEEREPLYFWCNYYVRHGRTSCTLCVSTISTPLLHLDAGQRIKLIEYLKTQHAEFL